jgi:hypothetical protein
MVWVAAACVHCVSPNLRAACKVKGWPGTCLRRLKTWTRGYRVYKGPRPLLPVPPLREQFALTAEAHCAGFGPCTLNPEPYSAALTAEARSGRV